MNPNIVNSFNAVEPSFLPIHGSMVIKDDKLSSIPDPQSWDPFCLKRSAAGILGFILQSYIPSDQLLHIIYDQRRFGYLVDKNAAHNIPALSVLENALNEFISHKQRLDCMRISSHEAFLLFHHYPLKIAQINAWNLQSIRNMHLLVINEFFDLIDGRCVSDASSISQIQLEEIHNISNSLFVMIIGIIKDS